MENLIFCINAVIPSFIIIAAGYSVRLFGLMEEKSVKQFNKVCFNIFLPLVMFKTAYTSNFTRDFDPRVIGVTVVCLLLMIALMSFIAPHFTSQRGRIGVMIQGSFRSNAVLMGIPFAISLCGEEAAGPAAVLVVFVVPLYNLLSVLVFSVYNDKEKTRPNLMAVVKKIITNPLIDGFLVGMTFNLLNIPLAQVIEKPVYSLASAGSTVAMFTVGAQLNFKNAVRNIKLTAVSAFAKLVVLPLMGTLLSIAVGLKGAYLCAPFLILSMPCATASAAQADGMNADGTLAAEMVVFTTAVSIVTIFIGSFVLKTLGLI